MRLYLSTLLFFSLPACNSLSGIDEFAVGTEIDHDAESPEGFPADTHIGEETGEDGLAVDSGPPDTTTTTTAPVDTGSAPIDSGTPEDSVPPCPTHSNGVGGTYVFCAPIATPGFESTYSLAMAQAARSSWLPGTDSEVECEGPGGSKVKTLARSTGTQCAMWKYTTTHAGFVGLTAVCLCPMAGSWD